MDHIADQIVISADAWRQSLRYCGDDQQRHRVAQRHGPQQGRARARRAGRTGHPRRQASRRRWPRWRLTHSAACDQRTSRVNKMIQDMIRNRWSLIGHRLQVKWAKLLPEDVNTREGHRDYLVNKLQERYGIAKEKARVEVKEFERSLR